MKKFRGIFPALVTPFDENGKIHPGAVEKLIESCLEKGASGFYVGGEHRGVLSPLRGGKTFYAGAGDEGR